MKKQNRQSEITRRLHYAAGHLDAVIEMIQSGQPWEQVLYQLNAVQAALRMVGIKIVKCQAWDSLTILLGSPSPEKRVIELERIRFLFSNAIQIRHNRGKNPDSRKIDTNLSGR